MAKALGIGGVFFRAKDPAGLAAWYARWLGVPVSPDGAFAVFDHAATPPGGATVWSPFAADTDYFGSPGADAMINFMVDDLDGALSQVREGGARQVDAVSVEFNGRFGWFLDPEGNKVELWEPAVPSADTPTE